MSELDCNASAAVACQRAVILTEVVQSSSGEKLFASDNNHLVAMIRVYFFQNRLHEIWERV